MPHFPTLVCPRNFAFGAAVLRWFAALTLLVVPLSAADLFVSPDGPLPSLAAARDEVRKRHRGGLREPIRVYLRSGSYRLDETFVLGPEDSGFADAPVIYSAYPGERAVLSGGVTVRHWRRGSGQLWTGDLDPSVRRAGIPRQLFVGGRRAQRARSPNRGFYRIPGPSSEAVHFQLPFAPGVMGAEWAGSGAEAVVLMAWTSIRRPVIAVDAERRVAELAGSSGGTSYAPVGDIDSRYSLENIRQALDSEGEWYYDPHQGQITYWPLSNEDPARDEMVVSLLPTLVRLEGDAERGRFVRYVSFRGITFRHTNWELGESGFGDDPQAAVRVAAAVEADGAEHCTVEECTFSQLGGYAIAFGRAARSNRITANTIFDTGAGGVKVGSTALAASESTKSAENLISDNHIHDIGIVYPGAVGILVLQSSRNRIVHNLIHDTNYTGISVGWTWGYAANQCSGNQIDFNHLHHIGRGMLDDLGAIYTLGVQPGTTIRNNLIHDLEPYSQRGRGIYLDEGSTDILVENNVVYRIGTSAFHQHYGRDNLVRNNIFALNREFQASRARAENHRSFTFERNIVLFDSGRLFGGAANDKQVQFARNLYFDRRGEPLRFGRWTFDEWRARGQDEGSIVADPQIAGADRGDFTLPTDSPARQIGFRAIDTSLAGVREAGDARVIRDLEYARANGKPLLLDLYLPEHAQGKLPVIVSIHGGGWHGGQKERSPGLHFTRYGYAVASVDYRLTGEAVFPAQIEDCKAAVRWLRAHAAFYGLDPDRFGAWGASAGGHLSALLGTSGGVAELEGNLGNSSYSSRVQAVVDYFGPIDVALWYRQKKQEDAALIGGPVTGNERRLALANPITYVDRGDPPTLIAHGRQDPLVPMSQSQLFEEALRKAGVPVQLHLVPGAGHSVTQMNLDREVAAFFDRYLK